MITVLYFFIIIILGINTNFSNQEARRRYILCVGIILTLISGFRHINYGTSDTYRYAQGFTRDAMDTAAQIWDSGIKDVGFHLVNHYLGVLFGPTNYQLMFIVYAIIFSSLICYVIFKESEDPLCSFIVLLTMGFFTFSMNGVRQGLALSFVVLSYIPLKQKQLFKFILLVLIGSFFHITCLIFLLAYPAMVLGFSKRSIPFYAITILTFLVAGKGITYLLVDELVQYNASRFEYYQASQVNLSYAGAIQYSLFLLFSLQNSRSIRQEYPESVFLYSLLILAIVFNLLSIYIAEMFRVAMYFGVFIILLLPKVFCCMPDNKKRTMKVALYTVLLAYYFIVLKEGFALHNTYKFFWQYYEPW